MWRLNDVPEIGYTVRHSRDYVTELPEQQRSSLPVDVVLQKAKPAREALRRRISAAAT